jgi:hypothetical protein
MKPVSSSCAGLLLGCIWLLVITFIIIGGAIVLAPVLIWQWFDHIILPYRTKRLDKKIAKLRKEADE